MVTGEGMVIETAENVVTGTAEGTVSRTAENTETETVVSTKNGVNWIAAILPVVKPRGKRTNIIKKYSLH